MAWFVVANVFLFLSIQHTSVVMVIGLISAAVHWLSGLWATCMLRHAYKLIEILLNWVGLKALLFLSQRTETDLVKWFGFSLNVSGSVLCIGLCWYWKDYDTKSSGQYIGLRYVLRTLHLTSIHQHQISAFSLLAGSGLSCIIHVIREDKGP